jgi:hypothetical protein
VLERIELSSGAPSSGFLGVCRSHAPVVGVGHGMAVS